ncbi:MAG: penicillin-insensitive murein endopeptidase [Rhizobiales bacterium]|nr:penicillin-insensitive murein endopeptidase [Hyphomicrobiales bacterium]
MTEAGLTMRMARAEDNVPAKQLFGAQTTPAPLKPASIGSYARGCLAGAQPIAIDGPNWQVMRLSRNRNWGHPALISYLEKLATDAGQSGMWNGLLVGDMAQPRGGPMLTGHNSHQIGLDADIWLTEMPNRRLTRDEREKTSAVSMVNFDTKQVNRNVWTSRQAALIKHAASYSEVARIFVNPIIKKELCRVAGDDRDWLRKVRPWAGHHFHMHIRLACPSGTSGCKNQPAPERDDGCGEDLARWFLPPTKPDKPARPRPPLTLANLPNACATVLDIARADGAASPKPTR